MADFINLSNQDFSFLGKGTKIVGSLYLQGASKLCSNIEGDITIEDKAHLSIEREGQVSGTIVCYDIDIFGEFNGTLNSKGKVTIHPPAKIQGEINSNQLIVHPGATINIKGSTENKEEK
jgi:cytoskeletal protein CcmA (bactofilin family)